MSIVPLLGMRNPNSHLAVASDSYLELLGPLPETPTRTELTCRNRRNIKGFSLRAQQGKRARRNRTGATDPMFLFRRKTLDPPFHPSSRA